MSELRRRAIQGLQAGDTFTLVRTVDEATTRAFGGLVGWLANAVLANQHGVTVAEGDRTNRA